MICRQCGKVPLSGNIDNWDNFICQDCKDAILERLEEVVSNYGGCTESELHGKELPCGSTMDCGFCLAFYIKNGRAITEEDLKGDQNVD